MCVYHQMQDRQEDITCFKQYLCVYVWMENWGTHFCCLSFLKKTTYTQCVYVIKVSEESAIVYMRECLSIEFKIRMCVYMYERTNVFLLFYKCWQNICSQLFFYSKNKYKIVKPPHTW